MEVKWMKGMFIEDAYEAWMKVNKVEAEWLTTHMPYPSNAKEYSIKFFKIKGLFRTRYRFLTVETRQKTCYIQGYSNTAMYIIEYLKLSNHITDDYVINIASDDPVEGY